MKTYHIRVDHKYLAPFFSFYDIEANDYLEAERKAKQRFKDDFCNSDMPLTNLEAYTFNKYR